MLQRSALTAAARGPKDRVLITCFACLVCQGRVIDTAVGQAVLIACGDLGRPFHTEREARSFYPALISNLVTRPAL